VKYIVGFGRFWYDFIVGDDWRIAVLVLGALAVVYALAHHAINLYWLLPVVVFIALTISLLRETRKR
jgi:hypothetical protein